MKFSVMSPAGAYAPTTHAPSARRQFQVSIVLVVVLVLAAVALAMSTGRPWLGRLRPAKISVPHVAETLLDIRGGLDKIVAYASPWSSGKPAKRGRALLTSAASIF